MKNTPSIAADIGRFAIAAIFVVMTMAFLTVPYALSSHPGEAMARTATAVHTG
ncbi:MAG TPA: hypothetical protein VF801_01220 [Rhodocyclaceae bacterium]